MNERVWFGHVLSPLEFQIKYLINSNRTHSALLVRYYVEQWYMLARQSPQDRPPAYDISVFLKSFDDNGWNKDYTVAYWHDVLQRLIAENVFIRVGDNGFRMHPAQEVEVKGS